MKTPNLLSTLTLFSTIAALALFGSLPNTAAGSQKTISRTGAPTDSTGFGLKDRFTDLDANFGELYKGGVGSVETITYGATSTINFAATAAGLKSETLTGNVTLASSGLTAGRTIVVRLIASGGARNLAFPAGWVFVGAAAPTALASGKTGLLVLRSFGTTDANVVARYDAQP